VVLVLLAVLIGVCRWQFAAAFRADHDRIAEIMSLDERELIKDHRLLVQSLVVLGVVLAAFVFHPVLGYEPSVVALLGAGLLVLVTRVTTEQALQDVEWGTLAFFMGLFVMVGSLVESGVLGAIAEGAAGFAGENLLGFTTVLVWGSGVLSGVVDNIPYVASMSPVVAGLVGPDGEPQVLWWALALGADLGGNATLIGASANVVVAGIADRNGYPIGFWQFTRYGLVLTFATIAVAYGYVVLRYFVLA
jgi:Na+/H+ antiporter NhaD/arsenite permease-like protein